MEYHSLSCVFLTYADNLKDVVIDDGTGEEEPQGVNPKAFSVTADVVDVTKHNSQLAKMLSDLFEVRPQAKITRISLSASLAEGNAGGTITISGTF